jgi:hypothetical protein
VALYGPLLAVEEAPELSRFPSNEFQSLLDGNATAFRRVVQPANMPVSARLRVAKALDIDYNR